jgi:prepilin-type processing-associated H-X9-DG protein
MDNDDTLPPNNFVYDIFSDTPLINGDSWCTNLAPFDANPPSLSGGLLYPYNAQPGIYHCPADKSNIETHDGSVVYPIERIRSYNMSQSINGEGANWLGIPAVQRYTAATIPDLSQLMTFIDVHEDEIIDTQFGMPLQNEIGYFPYFWYDVPANRHNQGANLSFADGHAEHWAWAVPKSVTVPRGNIQPVAPGELPDYMRLANTLYQQLDPF